MNLRCVFPFLFLISLGLGAQNLQQVEFKVFPQPYTVMSGGRILQPSSWDGTRKWFRLPPGPLSLTLSSPGFIPQNLRLNIAPGLIIQEKLEPRQSPLVRVAGITTGKGPKSLLFTPDSRKLLVPLIDDTGVDVISMETLQLLPRLSTGPTGSLKGFSEAAVSPSSKEIWVSQLSTGQIHRFNGTTLDYLGGINTGARGIEVLTFTADGSQVLVTNGEIQQVSLFDTRTMTMVKSLGLHGIPRGTALSPDGRWAFVTLFDGALVEKIDMTTFTSAGVLSYGPTGAMRHALSLGNQLYFSDMLRGGLISAESPSGKFLKFQYLGSNLTTVAADPSGINLFVASRGVNNPQGFTLPGPDFGQIFMVDSQTLRVKTTLWGKNQPLGLAVSPDGKWLAFSNFLDNQVEIYRIR